MGLEMVELVMHVEETFGISIPDKEAQPLETVEALHQCVLQKLEAAERQQCLTSFTFYRIRRALIAECGVPRKRISPSTPLDQLLPRHNRRDRWQHVQHAIDIPLPDLVRPARVRNLIVWPPWLGFIPGAPIVGLVSGRFYPAAMFFTGTVLCSCLVWLTTIPLASRFPVHDVGALTQAILNKHFGRIARMHKRWHPNEVWTTLKDIIVEELGVKPEDVVPVARFFEDFNAG